MSFSPPGPRGHEGAVLRSPRSSTENASRAQTARQTASFASFGLVAACLATFGAACGLDDGLEPLAATEERLVCRVLQTETIHPDGTSTQALECAPVLADGSLHPASYAIRLPDELVESSDALLAKGAWYVSIDGAYLDDLPPANGAAPGRGLVVPEGARIATVAAPEGLATAMRTGEETDSPGGTRKLVLFWIRTSNSAPTLTSQQMFDALFDAGGFATQYASCSFDQLRFEPYEGVGSDGASAIEIQLPNTIEEYDSGAAVRNAAIEVARARFGDDFFELADHYMFIVPPGGRGFIANAGTNSSISTYSDQWGSDLRTVMHELGHNLGLGHSGYNGDAYGDYSSYMSATGGGAQPTGPRQCFNGAEHWQLGWYPERRLSLDPALGLQKVKIAAFTDYPMSSSDMSAVVRVGAGTEPAEGDIYLQYNRKKSFNDEVRGFADTVTVVEQKTGSTELVAAVPVDGSFVYPADGSVNAGLEVHVCGPAETNACGAEYLWVSVGYGASACEAESQECDGGGCECNPGPFCGDGAVDQGEECDDGNTENSDGCSAACELEGDKPGDEPDGPGPGGAGDPGPGSDGDGLAGGCHAARGTSPAPLLAVLLALGFIGRRRRCKQGGRRAVIAGASRSTF